jgi:hypothetical protein
MLTRFEKIVDEPAHSHSDALNGCSDTEDPATEVGLRRGVDDLADAKRDGGQLVAEVVTDETEEFISPDQKRVGAGAFRAEAAIGLTAHPAESLAASALPLASKERGVRISVLPSEKGVRARSFPGDDFALGTGSTLAPRLLIGAPARDPENLGGAAARLADHRRRQLPRLSRRLSASLVRLSALGLQPAVRLRPPGPPPILSHLRVSLSLTSPCRSTDTTGAGEGIFHDPRSPVQRAPLGQSGAIRPATSLKVM